VPNDALDKFTSLIRNSLTTMSNIREVRNGANLDEFTYYLEELFTATIEAASKPNRGGGKPTL